MLHVGVMLAFAGLYLISKGADRLERESRDAWDELSEERMRRFELEGELGAKLERRLERTNAELQAEAEQLERARVEAPPTVAS